MQPGPRAEVASRVQDIQSAGLESRTIGRNGHERGSDATEDHGVVFFDLAGSGPEGYKFIPY